MSKVPAIRDRFTFHSTSIVCLDNDIKGDVTIGAGSIVHPKVTIYALSGPIVIGSGCIIEEGVIIVNKRKDTLLRIGDDNLLEIGCRIEGSIGNSNTISTKSRIHHTARLSSFSFIGPGALLSPNIDQHFEDYSVFYSYNCESSVGGDDARMGMRTWTGNGRIQEMDLRKKHVEYLKDMLPKFNRLRQTVAV